MSFQPIVPMGGLAGLRLVDRTYERQFEIFSRDPELDRNIAAFRERSAGLTDAASFVRDTEVLRVALGAYGLDDELPKRAFIRKVLEEGTLDPRSFANRLVDPAWRKLAGALGFGDLGPRLNTEAARERMVEAYRVRQFERAVGESDVNIRLALNFRREIATIATDPRADRVGWLRILGSEPLRTVVAGALNLPDQVAGLDLDAQRAALEDRAARILGSRSPAIFRDGEIVEEVLQRFLLRASLGDGPTRTTPGSTALDLLNASGLGAGARAGLFASRLLSSAN